MDKITVLMASIPQRSTNLKRVINTLYPYVDEIRLVLNDYESIPEWIKEKSKIISLLNNPDKYTSNSVWLAMGGINGYVFTCDDDILFPPDYVPTLISKIKEYNNKAIITLYGEIAKRPFTKYNKGRYAIGFFWENKCDREMDIAGAGCSLFHTDGMKPTLVDFPDIYSRDLWFSILAHKNNLPIIRIKSANRWLRPCKSEGPEICRIWRANKDLRERREYVFKNILIPLLKGGTK